MKIKNIEDLNKHVLDVLERLSECKIDVEEAGIVFKGSETIMSSLKVRLMYNNMRGEIPNIKFLEQCNEGERQLEKKDNIKVIK